MIEAQNQLLPAATRLLQPGSRFFRMVDAFAYLDANVPSSTVQDQIKGLTNTVNSQSTQISTLQGQVSTLQSQVATLQSQMTTANANISALQTQLDGVHFGAVMGAAPPAAATNRIDVTINSVNYSFALYAP
jgi:septal ring factor EnvC (AmiA/AmiB activator)